MNRKTLNILLKDRLLLILGAVILSAVIFTVTSFVYAEKTRAENRQLAAQFDRIHSESADILKLKEAVNSKERAAAAGSAGIVPTLENILKRLGLKASALKPLGKKKAGEFTEENAELEIKETGLNGIVNLLYMIDTSGAAMKIKSASIMTEFEDPDKFILKLTVARLSK